MHTFVIAACILAVCGCDTNTSSAETTITYPEVVRVFWHEKARYSIMVPTEDSTEDTPRYTMITFGYQYPGTPRKLQIIADVPLCQPMWARVRAPKDKIKDGQVEFYTSLEIHVHDPKSLEGGAWHHDAKPPTRGYTHPIF